MTLKELQDECWESLPAFRKRVAGREAVDDLIAIAVQNWAGDYLDSCTNRRQRDAYARELREQVRECHMKRSGAGEQRYGFIWIFVLEAVASAIIQWLVTRWLNRNHEHDAIKAIHAEMAR